MLQELEEEALMEQCIAAMLEDELVHQETGQWPVASTSATGPTGK